MDNDFDKDTPPASNTVESRLGEIARATAPPPARLPDREPTNIPATHSDTNATASLVLGIVSLCLLGCAVPVAILGLIFGLIAKGGKDTARIGIILNLIALGLGVLGGIGLLAYFLSPVAK